MYKEHLSLLVPDEPRFPTGTTTWSAPPSCRFVCCRPHMHERQIIDAAFASVGKTPAPRDRIGLR